jgi:helix-turn-helix protein
MPSVLADFTATFNSETETLSTPAEGRILLGSDQLVLAVSDDEQERIPLSAIVDITIGSVPKVFDPLPGTPISIALKHDGKHRSVLIAADEATIEKFATVLFKTMLNGASATIKHPAKLGGRVLDTEYQGGILGVDANAVKFETDDGPVIIKLDGVIDFSQGTQVVDGHKRSVLMVDHVQGDETLTTVAAMESSQQLAILGRLLRREYQKQMESLKELSLSGTETEVLTTIYSTGDRDISLSNVLGIEPKQVKQLLHGLHEEGLIESGDNGPILTAKGQVVVNHYLERVNE